MMQKVFAVIRPAQTRKSSTFPKILVTNIYLLWLSCGCC